MAYKQKSFKFWVSYYDGCVDFDDANRLAYYDAIMKYVFEGKDTERTLKKKGLTRAYDAFKNQKSQLKTSIERSKAGQLGNDTRWHEAPDEPVKNGSSQTHRKSIANASQIQSQIQSQSQRQRQEPERPPAACPRCGGPLDWTAVTKPGKRGVRRMFQCPKCHEEVWSA